MGLKWLSVLLLLGALGSFAAPAPAAAAETGGTWQWRGIIAAASAEYDVPAGLIQATMAVESGGNSGAYSYAGAIGLMQVMPGWFGGGENPWDPWTNIMKGASILRLCEDQAYGGWRPLPDPAGTWQLAIGCYLAGHPAYVGWYTDRVMSAWYDIAAQGG